MDPYKVPVMPDPSGAPPDFHTALTDIQVAIIAVFSVTFFFATISLVIRLFTVVRITRQFELDCCTPYPLVLSPVDVLAHPSSENIGNQIQS